MTQLLQKKSTYAFLSHMCKYIGVGLISGSIVHAGTLGGNYIKYLVLILLGILLFIIGNILEHNISSLRELLPYIGVSTILSIGTGMVSGGTQHYLDGPAVAAVLFPAGFILAYIAFIYRDYKSEWTLRRISTSIIVALLLYAVLAHIAIRLSIAQRLRIHNDVDNTHIPLQADGHRHRH
jgi:cation transporter-like permease